MLGRLILIMTVVPFIEIYLLLKMGAAFGAMPTFGLIILTGVVGAMLLQNQGYAVMREMQKQAAQGGLPQDAMIKGVFIFLGGVLLLTPGILTDAIGFSLIIPGTQHIWRMYFRKAWEQGVKNGNIHVHSNMGGFHVHHQGGFEDFIRQAQQQQQNQSTRQHQMDPSVIDIEATKSSTKKED